MLQHDDNEFVDSQVGVCRGMVMWILYVSLRGHELINLLPFQTKTDML